MTQTDFAARISCVDAAGVTTNGFGFIRFKDGTKVEVDPHIARGVAFALSADAEIISINTEAAQ